ncbi:TonB-dependent receptor [Steroidobacter flavus]|uniref:TonB-dependent receptor n=1 Tax=Steroidobacter flavus TaxID=1842136 RepID=A0ABV8T338_9GAMM
MTIEVKSAVQSAFAAASVFSSLLAGVASAQTAETPAAETAQTDSLEVITVTAQRREERSVDVPISIASLSGDTLRDAGVAATSALPQAVPGLRFDYSGSYVQPTIRGVGSALAGPGMNSNVAIYVDGFYVPNLLGSDFDLVSVQSVDVLKGPQGTLFGRNATGGAILVTTRDPTDELSGEIRAGFGSFGRRTISGYLSGGLTDTLSADLTAYYEEGDGSVKSLVTGKDDVAAFERSTVRSKILWKPSDNAKIALTLEHRAADDPTANITSAYEGLSAGSVIPGTLVATGPHNYSGTAKAGHDYKGNSATLRGDFDLGGLNFTSYSMYRDEKSDEAKDYDSTPVDIFSAFWRVNDKTVTQEFNLSSSEGEKFSWVTGLFYYRNENEYPAFNQKVGAAAPFAAFSSNIVQKSLAAFADGTYEIADGLFLTAGVRWGRDESDASYVNLVNPAGSRQGEHSWTSVTPRAVLRYELTPYSNVYASYTQGYKAGLVPITESTTPVDPEKINAYEVGYKLAGQGLTFDAAAFYYDYKDLQIASYVGTISLTRNAAESEIYGLDAQVTADLTDRWSVRAGATYVHSEYKSFPGAVSYQQVLDPTSPAYGIFINPPVDASGNQMQRAPETSGTLGVNYHQPVSWGELSFDANLYATSKFYFDPINRFVEDGYTLLNLRATWTSLSGSTSVTVYGNNVTDEDYRAEVLPGPFSIQQIYGEPAAAGLSVSYKF